MQYLGRLRGAGALTCGSETVARVDYDLEGFLRKPGQIACSGEIRSAPQDMSAVFGRRDLKLLTEDGRRLSVRFTEKKLDPDGDSTHVDVDGEELPPAKAWRR
jgi:hypothetical protein